MDATATPWGSVNSPCRPKWQRTPAAMAPVAQATCSMLRRSAQQLARTLWGLSTSRLRAYGVGGVRGLSSAQHRWGISRQRLCLVVLLVLQAKHQMRSVVLTAQVGEGRSVPGLCWVGAASCQGRSTICRVGHSCRRGWRKWPCLHFQDLPSSPKSLRIP